MLGLAVMNSPLPASGPSTIVFGSHTDLGKRRGNNEDSLRCGVLAAGTPRASTLLVVSDGVGGLKAGEVASRLAVESLHTLLGERLALENSPADRREWIDAAIRETDRRVRAAAAQPGCADMGATLSVLWFAGSEAWWGQVGDSRIYIFRRGVLRQLSRDQSPVGRLRAEGSLSEEQARTHPYRHLIDQCLGTSGAPVEPETGALPVWSGDVFLLCSDGLSDGLWDKEIAKGLAAVAAGQPPQVGARQLVERANDASGKDNITALVARADGGAVEGAPAVARASGWRRWLPSRRP